MQPLLASNRKFQIWLYTASHSQLLLRSNPSAEGEERIEVLFKGVCWMNLPAHLDGLVLTEAHGDSATELLERSGVAASTGADHRFFILRGSGYQAVVVALAAVVHRDHLSWDAPSGFQEQNLFVGVHRNA